MAPQVLKKHVNDRQLPKIQVLAVLLELRSFMLIGAVLCMLLSLKILTLAITRVAV